MKANIRRYIYICVVVLACACLGVNPLQAQMQQLKQLGSSMGGNSSSGGRSSSSKSSSKDKDNEEDPCIPKLDKRFCYTLDPITGIVHEAVPDTSYLNMGNRESMESRALAIAYTGNKFSPHQVEAFFDRSKTHDFLFLNAYSTILEDASKMLYYNTRMPFTVARYSNSGSSVMENDYLVIDFAGNLNKKIGLGSKLDYTYARGTYLNASTKPLKWKSYLYYNGEQYQAYLSYQKAKIANQENGGILNRQHVLTPDTFNRNFTEPRTMPTRLQNVWNDNMLNQIHFQHNYVMGYWEDVMQEGDTVPTERLVPVGTIFHSVDFESWKHIYRMDEGGDISTNQDTFKDYFINSKSTLDSTSYRDFSTYLGIRLDEGFSKYSQFAIAAFVGFEHQNYQMMQDTLDLDYIDRTHASNTFWLGGQLSRHLSEELTFDATAKTAISGDKAGDVEINGNAQSVVHFGPLNETTGKRADSLIVQVNGGFNNLHRSWMMQHYFSNHFRWNISDDDVKPEQHSRIDGKILYPRTGTSVRVAYENMLNYHYFKYPDFVPLECGSAINVWAVELRQNLHVGKWLNWDNAILYQQSDDQSVLPLPKLSIETDLSLRFVIAKSLAVQLGAAGYYHTKYYAPNYQPALQQFGVQNEIECGGFPVVNAYMNCNLKRIKFFVEMQNVLGSAVTTNTFLMPYYPIEPRRFGFGIVLDLQN